MIHERRAARTLTCRLIQESGLGGERSSHYDRTDDIMRSCVWQHGVWDIDMQPGQSTKEVGTVEMQKHHGQKDLQG